MGGFGAGTLATDSNHRTFIVFAETGTVGVVAFIVILGILFLAADTMSGASKSFWFTVLAVWTVGGLHFELGMRSARVAGSACLPRAPPASPSPSKPSRPSS